jgi:hypothetical protein
MGLTCSLSSLAHAAVAHLGVIALFVALGAAIGGPLSGAAAPHCLAPSRNR